MPIAVEDVSESAALRAWCSLSTELEIPRRLRLAARECQTLGQAFALGIQASITHFMGAELSGVVCAVGVSEDGGSHPRRLATTLSADGRSLTGHKSFVTLGASAEVLLIAARDHMGVCRVCLLRSGQPGFRATELPPMAYAPDLKHARLTLDGAVVHQVLEGDGYTDFVKPFRVMEDLYTRLAASEYAAMLLDPQDSEIGASLGEVKRELQRAIARPDDAESVEAALASADTTLRALPSAQVFQSPWSRDLQLLQVGASARAARLAKARHTRPQ